MILTPKRRLWAPGGSVDFSTGSLSLTVSPVSPQNFTWCGFCYLPAVVPGGATNSPVVFSLDDGTNDVQLFIHSNTSGSPQLISIDTGASTALATAVVGQWFFLACTSSAATATGYYRTRSSTFTTASRAASPATTGSFFVGADGFADPSWTGSIAGSRIWSRILSARELIRESQQLAPVSARGLASYLRIRAKGGAGADAFLPARVWATTGTLVSVAAHPPVPEVLVRKSLFFVSAPVVTVPKDPIGFSTNA